MSFYPQPNKWQCGPFALKYALVMLGVFAGYILQSDKPPMKKFAILVTLGIVCILVGRIWGIWFPIIHHLWTSSMVLYAGGLSFLLLSMFYLVIDVWGYKKWAFVFVVIGMNAIAVYVATRLFDFKLIGNVKSTSFEGVKRPVIIKPLSFSGG